MSVRRNAIMNLLANSFKWLLYSFAYLYNSLVPTTIDGKSVKDKARIKKIYANGVIENQLCSILTNDFAQDNLTITYDATINGFIVNGTANADGYVIISNTTQTILNHKYLVFGCSGGGANTYHIYLSGNNNDLDTGNGVIFNVSVVGMRAIIFRYKNGVSFNNIKIIPQLIDLTQMFGTGNEPTTLTDNRIQKILNSGYIANNAGTYKGTDISEFSSESSNKALTFINNKYINSSGEETSSSGLSMTTSMEIPSNTVCTLKGHCTNSNIIAMCWFDSSNTFISRNTKSVNANEDYELIATSPSNAKYCICNVVNTYSNITFTFQVNTIAFIYQGNGALNSHDTLEITSSEYVFTKNNSSYTFNGNETWNVGTGGYGWALFSFVQNNGAKPNSSNNLMPNMQFEKYANATPANITSQNVDKAISYNTSGSLLVRDTSITTASDMATAMVDKTIYFELATPQVIRIPRKHLGIVDLGSLNWNYDENNARFFVDFPYIKRNTTNMYCEKYLYHAVNSSMSDKQIGCVYVGGNDRIYIKDYLYTTATDFKNAMSGVYLFYETEEEVADIANIIGIEAGGTITSDSDVLPNVDFDIKCK